MAHWEINMAERDQSSTNPQAKPIPSPDDRVKTVKKDDTELTDDALSNVDGGLTDLVVTKHTDTTSPL
jgi:hypothetical protein